MPIAKRSFMRGSKRKTFSLDVLFAGDMAAGADNCLRIAGEASAAEKAGYRTGLLHIPSSIDETPHISPELRACLRQSSIAIVEEAREAVACLLIVHPPCGARAPLWIEAALKAERIVLVPDAGSLPGEETLSLPAAVLRKLSVAPTSDTVRDALRGIKLRIERASWPPVIHEREVRRSGLRRSPAIGALIPPDWPGSVDVLQHMLRDAGHVSVHIWRDRGSGRQAPKIPGGWRAFDGEETSFAWFLRRIDVLMLLDQPGLREIPEAVIAAAHAAGVAVVAPPSLAPHVSHSVSIIEPADLASQIPDRAVGSAAPLLKQQGSEIFVKKLSALVKTRPKAPRKALPPAARRKPRVLFVPKGGVGLGHVMRLLAVARRSAAAFDPVFVSLSESPGMIEALGFRTEFIPSTAYADVPSAEWDPWFQYEIEQLIDAYDASAVVYDGSDPPAVLSRAVASRSWCRAVWMRRGMWAPGYDPSLQRSSNYDLIIEPGDLAASRDRGATAARRDETMSVDPITLLDERELLSRADAAKVIGFDPTRPAMLLQIGSGENRDILSLIDQSLQACRRHPDLQIAVAEWANAGGGLDLWPGITVLKGMPLSQYFRAFDFTISAAGYNSFHEIINFGLPSILVPNQAPRMDDQAGRSAYAQDEGAAIELKEHEFAELPSIIDLLMKPEFRTVMQGNCRRLARGNGAEAAARIIADLVN